MGSSNPTFSDRLRLAGLVPGLLLALAAPPAWPTAGAHRFTANDVTYTFTFKETGENFTFEFDRNPGSKKLQLQAAGAVFKTVYGDDSIAPTYRETFMKEGALCFVFPASFHSYTACFLPNHYVDAPEQRDRFWGYVTRVPNAAWLITRNLLPALLVLGAFFYSLRPRRRS